MFTVEDREELILFKFNLWIRKFFCRYIKQKSPEFHNDIDNYNLQAYKGLITSFTDIVFRGGAKTSRTKLFLAFCIANDTGHFRKYIKVLSADNTNSRQITTDIYNMFVQPEIKELYPEIFEKTQIKREETMGSFTTSTGIKVLSGTVGTEQRGALKDEARPDLILFEDFETRKTIRSAVQTQAIWENMEEARTSLSTDGACIYNCNYITEAGNVNKLVKKKSEKNIVMIIPIISKDGELAWPHRYDKADIEQMKKDDEDFEGERLCEPSKGADIMFDRDIVEAMPVKQPILTTGGFRIFKKYDPSHAYGSGHDISKGVGLDSSASVFIDFSTIPACVVGVFADNMIKPETMGDEIYREQMEFPSSIAGIENNYGGEAILRMKQLGGRMYLTVKNDKKILGQKFTDYGWNTNSLTKPKMINSLVKAINDGLLAVWDEALQQELKSYTRHDLLDTVKDPRLTTRHFDLLMALAIAWQMKDFAIPKEIKKEEKEECFETISQYEPSPDNGEPKTAMPLPVLPVNDDNYDY